MTDRRFGGGLRFHYNRAVGEPKNILLNAKAELDEMTLKTRNIEDNGDKRLMFKL